MSAEYVGDPARGWPDVLRVKVWSTATQPEERYTLFRRVNESDHAFRQRAQARAAEVQRVHPGGRAIHIFCVYDYDAGPLETDDYRNALLKLRHTIETSRDAEEQVAAISAMGQMYGWLPVEGRLQ